MPHPLDGGSQPFSDRLLGLHHPGPIAPEVLLHGDLIRSIGRGTTLSDWLRVVQVPERIDTFAVAGFELQCLRVQISVFGMECAHHTDGIHGSRDVRNE
jgi:hypothetical protein